jgi:hypothetical protein
MSAPRYVIIASPESKRWQAYSRELTAFWAERGVRPPVELVPWSLIVPRDGNLDGLAPFDEPALVRIDSPSRDFEVMKQLLQAGERNVGRFSKPCHTDWAQLPYRKGELVRPGLLARGFERVLHGLRRALDGRPHLRPLACPLAVARMFDKNATCQRLREAGIPTPPFLEPFAISNWDGLPTPTWDGFQNRPTPTPEQLLEAIRLKGWPSAYTKLNSGFSAVGIAVVHASAPEPWAITTLIRLDDRYYNTRRLQRPSGDKLNDVLAFLIREGVCVQQGIRMPQIDGQNFDVRVVVIHGRPAFTIFRLSSQPMTNLHLGGRRGRPDLCRAAIPTRAWLDAVDHCLEAAALFPSAVAGVDLLFERGFQRHYVLELNAFGDFFPGLIDEDGRSVYRAEIEETARAFVGS